MKSIKSIVFASLACLGSISMGQAGPDVVIAGEYGYILGVPEVISQATVQDFDWSADGRFLIYKRTEPPTQAEVIAVMAGLKPPKLKSSIMVWAAGAKAPRLLWRLPNAERAEAQIYWLTGTHTVLVRIETSSANGENMQLELVRANAETGEAVSLISGDSAGLAVLDVFPSPLGPVAIASVAQSDSKTWHVRLVRERGPPSPSVDTGTRGAFTRWDNAGRAILTTFLTEGESTGLATRKDMLFDPETLTVSPINGAPPPTYSKPESSGLFDIEIEARPLITSELKRLAKNAWLKTASKSRRTQAFVAADVDDALLSPKIAFVAYTSQGILAVRPLIKTKAADIEEALDAAERGELINRAKQVGLSALMYAGDHDDTLPSSGLNSVDLFLPYSKNASLYDGFVYTFTGGALQNVENVSTTELGYIPGKGGRAVIYVDGHARWIKTDLTVDRLLAIGCQSGRLSTVS